MPWRSLMGLVSRGGAIAGCFGDAFRAGVGGKSVVKSTQSSMKRRSMGAVGEKGAGMKLRTDHWQLRLMGVLFGLGSLIVGLSGMFFGEAGVPADFAIIAIVTGLIATLGSLISGDIIGFWYCNGKRLAARRAREARSSDLSTGP